MFNVLWKSCIGKFQRLFCASLSEVFPEGSENGKSPSLSSANPAHAINRFTYPSLDRTVDAAAASESWDVTSATNGNILPWTAESTVLWRACARRPRT